MSRGGMGMLVAALGVSAVAVVVYWSAREPASAPAGTVTGTAGATDGSADGEGDAAGDVDPATLAGAIAKARPLMTDRGDGTSGGTLVLLGWSTRHLGWNDVAVEHDETTFDRTVKTPDPERGKRLCASGKIVAVNPVRTDATLFWNGVLLAPHDRPFAFLAVGGMGPLEAGNNARLCGIVTGRTQTREGSGQPRAAVVVVGMFDVPENHHLGPR